MEQRFSIRPFHDSDKDAFKALIQNYWNDNHVFLQSDKLLWWQYEGYGRRKGVHFPLLFEGNKLIGFRGFYPAELRIPCQSRIEIEPLAIGALYLVLPDYRGQKLGLALQQYTIEHEHNYLAIASNLRTSAPLYKKSGYFMQEQMLRYLLPLNERYKSLLCCPGNMYQRDLFHIQGESVKPTELSAVDLQDFWQCSIGNLSILSLNKTKDFWQWRFLDNPCYDYLFFGGMGKGGVIVARICDLFDNDQKRAEKIFRILEFIPERTEVWDGVCDDNTVSLLTGILRWAQQKGCVGAEFYVTTHRLSSVLEAAGMKEVNRSMDNKYLDIVSYYEPVTNDSRLSNVSLCIPHYLGNLDFNDVYFTLSDADQDRPNILI